MKQTLISSFFLLAVVFLIGGCDATKETFNAPQLTEYYPFKVGTSQLYRLDSTVRAPSNTELIVRSYQAKDSVESTFLDNEGRQSYRIFRFVRNLSGTQPWQFAATFFATPTQKSIEYVDNNLRFIKLVAPITNNYTFKGNSFIQAMQGTSKFDYLYDWNYEYRNVGEPYKIGNRTFDSTVTVFQQDETFPQGPFDPALPAQIRTYGVEVYAKGVGLIYKEFLYWNWQRNPPPAQFEQASYGVKLTLMNP
jgi:hypothetical protein